MRKYTLTAHLVLTTMDYERFKIGLKMIPGYPVYVGYNITPQDMHIDTAMGIEIETIKILEELGTLSDKEAKKINKSIEKRYSKFPPSKLPNNCDTDRVKFIPLNFYSFEDALVELYALFYRESLKGNQLVINISGGTKPATIAATYAASLTMNATPIYFVSEKWEFGTGNEPASQGVAKEPIQIGALFDLRSLLPTGEEDKNIIRGLTDGEAKTIKEILERAGVDSDRKYVAKYAYYVNKLSSNNIIEMGRGVIRLTPIGILIARLVNKKIQVEDEVNKSNH